MARPIKAPNSLWRRRKMRKEGKLSLESQKYHNDESTLLLFF